MSAHNIQQNILLGYSDAAFPKGWVLPVVIICFWMIVAAHSARHSGALSPFFSAFGAVSGDGTLVNELHVQCGAQVWGRGAWFWQALAQPGVFGQSPWFGHSSDFHMQWFFLIHNVETKNHLALNFKPLPAFPWEWAFLANPNFLNITSPITFSQVSIYAGLASPIHGAGTGLKLNALQVAGGALGSLAKLVPDGHTVWVITSAH